MMFIFTCCKLYVHVHDHVVYVYACTLCVCCDVLHVVHYAYVVMCYMLYIMRML